VVNGQSGLLTPPGDVDALATALIDLLTSDARRADMARAARRRAEAEYTLEHMARRMEATYAAALGA